MADDQAGGGGYASVLTEHERRVAHAVGRGATNKATARELGVSVKTVEFHLGKIYRKLDLQGRAELAHLVGANLLDAPTPTTLGNLPHQRSRMIGRERELTELATAIDEHTLVNVVGAGGAGKTRLALAGARQVAPGYPDGGWLVELAPIADSGRVATAVATTLGLRLRTDVTPGDLVADALRARRLLLVLDNCEHVLDAAADLVDRLGAWCPEVSVLATSRQRLEVDGEHVLVLAPLALDDAGDGGVSEAARLFCDRAAGVLGRFDPSAAELAMVDAICRRLDGLPLAIELAVGRLATMTLADLSDGLDQRFELLTRSRGAALRHLSLRATLGWSYALLDESERRLFDDTSVFLGGFGVDGAVAVSGDALAGYRLDALGERSLLTGEDGPLGKRFAMLETLRQFGDGNLRAAGLLAGRRRRHLDYFLQLAAEANQGVRCDDELPWHRTFMTEWPNLEQAFGTSCELADADAAFSLIANVLYWAVTRMRLDLAQWASSALRLPSGCAHPLRSTVRAAAAVMTCLQGSIPGAIRLRQQAEDEERAFGPAPEPWVLRIRPWAASTSDEIVDAARQLQVWARNAGSMFWLVWGMQQEAAQRSLRINRGTESAEADAAGLAQIRTAAALAEDLGNPNAIAFACMTLGGAVRRREPAEAIALLERSLTIAAPLDLELTATQAQRELAATYLSLGRIDEALNVIGGHLARHLRAAGVTEVMQVTLRAVPALLQIDHPGLAAGIVAWARGLAGTALDEPYGLVGVEDVLRDRLGDFELGRILATDRARPLEDIAHDVLAAIDDRLASAGRFAPTST